MKAKWKDAKTKKRNFEKDLDLLLEEYDYFMDLRLKYTNKGIEPILIVDERPKENVKEKRRSAKKSKKK